MQRESIMSKLTLGIPLKTRLPVKAWMLFAIVALFSLASSALHLPTAPSHSIYAAIVADWAAPRG
jgi:hypothetical protein